MPDIRIDLARQWLELRQGGELLLAAPVSTAAAGLGEQAGSFRTPRGRHVVRARIGAGAPVGAVFVGRRWTGEVYSPQLAAQHPGRDWILTRILWLSGCELGRNRLGEVDTFRRYIYIHGTPDTTPTGHARLQGLRAHGQRRPAAAVRARAGRHAGGPGGVSRLLARLASTAGTLLAVLVTVFLLVRVLPGDPVEVMLGERASGADRAALVAQLGLDRPLATQLGDYLLGLARLDSGTRCAITSR